MLANNEVGTVEDVASIAGAARARNPRALVHTDAVQGLGRLPLGLDVLGVDLISLSAHKAHGPQGVGALVARHGVFPAAQLTGGGQERGRRSGTENVAGIAGFGVAAELAERRREADVAMLVKLAGRLTNLLTAHPGRRAHRRSDPPAPRPLQLRGGRMSQRPAACGARRAGRLRLGGERLLQRGAGPLPRAGRHGLR